MQVRVYQNEAQKTLVHCVDPTDAFGITRDYFKWTQKRRNKGVKILLRAGAPNSWTKCCNPHNIRKFLSTFFKTGGGVPFGVCAPAQKYYQDWKDMDQAGVEYELKRDAWLKKESPPQDPNLEK